jgi:hypothetical protein
MKYYDLINKGQHSFSNTFCHHNYILLIGKSPLVFLKLSNFNPLKHEEEREEGRVVRDSAFNGGKNKEKFLRRFPGSTHSSF